MLSFGNLSVYNHVEHQRKSKQIDLLSRGDFSPIQDELNLAYPNTDLPVRAVPFVIRYAQELGGLYSRPVVRRFYSKSGKSDPAVWLKLQDVYRDSSYDRKLERVETDLWLQNMVMSVVLPDGLGKTKPYFFHQWQVESVTTDDAMFAEDPLTWERIIVEVPMTTAAMQVIMGRMVLTRTQAWREIKGNKVGIYNDDLSHPFGRVPVCVGYRVRPEPGRVFPPVNEAVLNLQVALSMQEADYEHIVRSSAFPQKWIRNATQAQLVEELHHGPDTYLAMVHDGDPTTTGPELAVAQGIVPVEGLAAFSEHQIRLFCSMLGLDPSTFLKSNTATTAMARLYSAQDRQALRDRILPALVQFENDLLRDTMVVLSNELVTFPSDMAVSVAFNPYTPSPDPLTSANALQLEINMGTSSPVDAVMVRDGVSRTEATATVQRNLSESRAFGIIADDMEDKDNNADDNNADDKPMDEKNADDKPAPVV